jgi:hypothetical protein
LAVARDSARVIAAVDSVSSSSPRCAKTCSPCSIASAQTDTIAFATAGGSEPLGVSMRARSSFHNLRSSLIEVRLRCRIST